MSAGPGSAVKEKSDVVVTGGDDNDYEEQQREEEEYQYDYNNAAKTQRANHSHSNLGYKKADFYQYSG